MRNNRILLAGGIALLLALYSKKSSAARVVYAENPVPGDDWFVEDDSGYLPTDDGFDFGGIFDVQTDRNVADQRVRAFLYMIGSAETSPELMANGRAFHTYYGFSTFENLSDHPSVTKEKSGVPLSNAVCAAAGFGPGCVSTAAGAFQINGPTWQTVRQARPLWGAYLSDFSPASQTEAARRVLILAGALGDVERGDFSAALNKASTRWASLPGSTAKQGTRNYAWVQSVYEGNLYA